MQGAALWSLGVSACHRSSGAPYGFRLAIRRFTSLFAGTTITASGFWLFKVSALPAHLPDHAAAMDLARSDHLPAELRYIQYEHGLEAQYLPAIRALISKDLSEPYSIYVYRYFLCQWAHLCFMVRIPKSTAAMPANTASLRLC